MRAGRKVDVTGLIDPRDGSEEAKRKAELFLKNIRGELTVEEMAEKLGVSEAMAYRLRERAIESLVAGLEPKPAGRPAKERPDGRVVELEEEVKELKREILASEIREELRAVSPGLGRKKKTRERENR